MNEKTNKVLNEVQEYSTHKGDEDEVKKRAKRPVKYDAKFTLRFPENELNELRFRAETRGVTLTEYCREILMNHDKYERKTFEQIELQKQEVQATIERNLEVNEFNVSVRKIGVNINQIARAVNAGKVKDINEISGSIAHAFDELSEQLKMMEERL